MDIKTIFRRLGLVKHADLVYKVLQKDGPLLIYSIAKSTMIHRPAVYSAINDLLKHNFISVLQKGGRKLYQANSPDFIAEAFSREAEHINTEIKKMHDNQSNSAENMRILRGRAGVQEAFDDVIEHTPRGATFYRYTSERDLEMVNSYLSKDYRTRRDAKKLERLVISNPESGKQKRPRLERFIRYIPPENSVFDQNVIQTIYGDRVSFIDLNSERVVIIENKALAEFQKVIFRQLYKKLE